MQPPLSDDVAERLDELAELLDACGGAFFEMSAQTHWRPAPGSPAARVQRGITDPADNSDDILSGYDLVSEVVATYLEIAAGHFRGLGALLRGREAVFAPLPLIRSIIEHAAHTIWVLGDPADTANNMLARAYLEEFASCEYAKLAAERMGLESSADHAQRWKTVRARAMAAFPDATRADLCEDGGRTLAGQKLPGPDAVVQQMFDYIHRTAGGTATSRQAAGVYAYFCGGTHPATSRARQLRVPVDHGDHAGTAFAMDIESLERMLAIAVFAFYNALGYTMSFLGGDETPKEGLADRIDEVLPSLFR